MMASTSNRRPTPDDVLTLRSTVQSALELGITAAQDWCAAAVCTQRRAWQQWERGERAIHPGIYKLACIEVAKVARCSNSNQDTYRSRI